ncbi:MAG: hypothetical protein QNK11_06440 [Legionella sp.]|nr:hypothetical protein [Legionella sp.]
MKGLAMMAVTGVIALALAACGGNDAPPMPDVDTNEVIQPIQQPAQDTTSAAPETESEAVVAVPAPAAPAPEAAIDVNATEPTDMAVPTDEQITGATAPE